MTWETAAWAAGAAGVGLILLIGLGWTARTTRAFPGSRTAAGGGAGCLLLLAAVVSALVAVAAAVR